MKTLIACIACLLFFVVVEAALKEKASDRANKIMPLRRQLVPQTSQNGRQNLNRENQRRKHLHQILNANRHYDFHLVRSAKTVQGNLKRRLQVTFDGLPILGVNVQATYDSSKGYTGGLTGEIVSGIENDIPDSNACKRENEFLFSLGKLKFGLPANCENCRLVETNRSVYLDAETTAHLVYTIDIINDNPLNFSRPFLIVDACNRKTYEMFNRVHNNYKKPSFSSNPKREPDVQPVSNNYKRQACMTQASGRGGNPKTPAITYGTPPYCLDVWRNGGICQLINPLVRVIDLDQSTSTQGKPTYQYNCANTNDAINGAPSANLDAFFYGTVMSTIFQNEYNIYHPLGYQMKLYTHYGNNYQNAFWDGTSVKFGDGGNFFYPLISLDILAHEVAHGITDRYSNLYYSKQSGGINEAFSDITGEAIEFLASYRNNDWLVGYEIVKSANQALRYLYNPTLDGVSIAHVRNYYDGLDVHLSSGVYNKAFYEMVATQRIPMKDAYNCFLRANQIYWGVNTDFVQGACDVQSAAIDLGVSPTKIRAAFRVVGIDSNSCGGNAPMETLDPGFVRITVSRTINPCFLLLPKSRYWYYVYIYTTNSRRTNVAITIKNGVTGQTIGTRYNRLGFYLPNSLEDRIVCFSSHVPTTVNVNTYYCNRNYCYH